MAEKTKYDRFLSFTEIQTEMRNGGHIGPGDTITSFGDVAVLVGKKIGEPVDIKSFQDCSMWLREAFGDSLVGVDDPDFDHGRNSMQTHSSGAFA
jgi:hypothetical protein